MVHLLIHTWDRRALRPRYGVMPSGFSGIIRPWLLLGSWAAYGGRRGNIDLPDLENIMMGFRSRRREELWG